MDNAKRRSKRSSAQILRERQADPPQCQCGCGQTVEWGTSKNRWNNFLPGHNKSTRIYQPDVKKEREKKAPKCACGCGQNVLWNGALFKWNKCIQSHSPTVYGRKADVPEKQCDACGKIYKPTTYVQKRCFDCIESRYKGEGKLCDCGCGERCTWNYNQKKWFNFKVGHSGRVFKRKWKRERKDPETLIWHIFNCAFCDKENRVKRKKKYCSHECYAQHHSGQNNSLWEGGSINGRKWKQYKYTGKENNKEHRIIVSRMLGRDLRPEEVVHHRDRDGLNNSRQNLFLFHCSICHSFHHKTGLREQYRYEEVHHLDTMCRIVEKALGRPTVGSEKVFHLKREKSFRRISNLWVFHCGECRTHFDKSLCAPKYSYNEVHPGKLPDPNKSLNYQYMSRRKLNFADRGY